jgi:predicted nucleotidyltransferase
MDMSETWIEVIKEWAERTPSIRAVWLFGSRAKGTSDQESDVDLAIYLMPPDGKTNWALGVYTALGDQWQRELASVIGRCVSLEAVIPGTPEEVEIHALGSYFGRGKRWHRVAGTRNHYPSRNG